MYLTYECMYDCKVNVVKDAFIDKKYIIKITNSTMKGGGESGVDIYYKNKLFITLLSRLGIFTGITVSKEYNSAFFYVRDDFCSLRDFLKKNVDKHGYGSGYSCVSNYGNDKYCNISYDMAIFMADSLCKQIALLEKMELGFYCFSLDNVYVIDNHKFVYLGIEHLIEIKRRDRNGNEKILQFMFPFPEKRLLLEMKSNLFISPEIKNIDVIPFWVLYSSTYYHLAALIIYCMFNKNICLGDGGDSQVMDEKSIIKLLSGVVNTKLYWFLIRSTHNDGSKRVLVWV